MNIKKILFIVMCAFLALTIIITGIVISRAVNMFQGFLAPATPTTENNTTATEETEASKPTEEATLPTEAVGSTDPVHEHVMETHETKHPSCTTYGYTILKCQCGKTEMENFKDPLGHSYGAGQVIAPTCTEKGYTRYECTRCDEVDERNETAALGHSFDIIEEFEATCENNAYVVRSCSNKDCTETVREETLGTSLGGHKFTIEKESKPATCTEDGYTLFGCANEGCTAEDRKVLPATGHSFGPWEEVGGGKQSACTNDGCTVVIKEDDLKITERFENGDRTHFIIEIGTDTIHRLADYDIVDNRDETDRTSNPLTFSVSSAGLTVEYKDSEGTPIVKTLGFSEEEATLTIEGTPDPGVSEPGPSESQPSGQSEQSE